jgi:hypothetical protein
VQHFKTRTIPWRILYRSLGETRAKAVDAGAVSYKQYLAAKQLPQYFLASTSPMVIPKQQEGMGIAASQNPSGPTSLALISTISVAHLLSQLDHASVDRKQQPGTSRFDDSREAVFGLRLDTFLPTFG